VSKLTSLKLPVALKAQLENDAQRAGLSLHAFMLQTLADSVRHTRMREAFTQDAMTALNDMKTSGLGYELGDGLRELIISRRRSGYLARYEIDDARSLVLVARIRHQRESGYSAEEL
jgi:plasmid stabilization system protein ParE